MYYLGEISGASKGMDRRSWRTSLVAEYIGADKSSKAGAAGAKRHKASIDMRLTQLVPLAQFNTSDLNFTEDYKDYKFIL